MGIGNLTFACPFDVQLFFGFFQISPFCETFLAVVQFAVSRTGPLVYCCVTKDVS